MSHRSKPANLLSQLNSEMDVEEGLKPSIEFLVRTHRHAFLELRSAGLKWSQIARHLNLWRKQDGRPLSADQLRGVYSRISKTKPQTEVAQIQESKSHLTTRIAPQRPPQPASIDRLPVSSSQSAPHDEQREMMKRMLLDTKRKTSKA